MFALCFTTLMSSDVYVSHYPIKTQLHLCFFQWDVFFLDGGIAPDHPPVLLLACLGERES